MADIKEETIFQLILHAGNGRSSSMEAIQAAKAKNFTLAANKLEEANHALEKAHEIQTSLIQNELNGAGTVPTLLVIHAQDHLMNAITVKDLAQELIEIYKQFHIK
ncbi:PTS lactose/cellobiose transporter subunit IIA [Sporolactobacillus terrae]|uniref:PTS lactose/cellobiose transporter subunit IIA n=1 Tax=Sporolactobacillus terrae TaxID=269673 RepID=UPI00048D606F|nr:PTS lactose/cellobiose transporter subunit IIA [Sporolactobacillus terrae]